MNEELTRQLLQRLIAVERRLGIQETIETGAAHTHSGMALQDAANVYTANNTFSRVILTRTDLTIASGVITVTGAYHRVDTEGSAASDDLDTIDGEVAGSLLILSTVNNGRDVVVKHNTGNIRTPAGTDITLGEPRHTITLIYNTSLTAWQVVAVANT